MKNTFFLIAIIALVLSSCSTDNKYEFDKNSATFIADSIMYTAIVHNPDPADDYMDEWLKNVKSEVLADAIFKAVYKEKLIAYDYITGKAMTIKEVKDLEEEYARETIGKLLFTEEWYFDEENMQMHKKVNSIMLAYERKDENSVTYSYKAGIRVYLNGTEPMKAAENY